MLINEKDKKTIQSLLGEHLRNPVKLVLFTQKVSNIAQPFVQPCHWCQETESLLEEVASLSVAAVGPTERKTLNPPLPAMITPFPAITSLTS